VDLVNPIQGKTGQLKFVVDAVRSVGLSSFKATRDYEQKYEDAAGSK
jgi:hypothetical protein